MIQLATHHVAASTVSAILVTAHFAISPALSIAPHARSPTHQANPHIRPQAPFTASQRPPAILPAASAAPHTTEPAALAAQPTTDPAALAAQPTTDPAVLATELTADPAFQATHPTADPAASATQPTTEPAALAAPEATEPAALAAPEATEPAVLAAPEARDHTAFAAPQSHEATQPATPVAFHNVHFSILSSENSPPPMKNTTRAPMSINRSFGSIFHQTKFQAKSIIVAQINPASLVLYHTTRAAPAKICPNVATQNQTLLGRISRKGMRFDAAHQIVSIFHGIHQIFPNPAINKRIPTATRIIQSTFHIIINRKIKDL